MKCSQNADKINRFLSLQVQDLTTPKPKKTLASRISNQFERLKRSSSADKSRDSRLINISQNEAGFSPHFRPRRTFYNVIPSHHRNGSMRSRRYYLHPPVSASVTPSWVNSPKEGKSTSLFRLECWKMNRPTGPSVSFKWPQMNFKRQVIMKSRPLNGSDSLFLTV